MYSRYSAITHALLAVLLIALSGATGFSQGATKPGTPAATSGRPNLRTVLKPIAKDLGINLIIDISARDAPANFAPSNFSAKSDLEEFLQKQKFATTSLDQNILLIYADTPENRKRIEENKVYSLRGLEPNGGADDGDANQDGVEALRAAEVRGSKYQVAFWNMSRKMVLSRVADGLKFKVVFDESVGDSLLNIDLKEVELNAAFEQILEKEKLKSRKIDEHTILVFAAKPEGQSKFDSLKLWTAILN
jgi:hypothetical protein